MCHKYVVCCSPLQGGTWLTCHKSRYTTDWSVRQHRDRLHCLCVRNTAAGSSVWCQVYSVTRWWWPHHNDQPPTPGHLVTHSGETLHMALQTLWQVSSPPPSTLGYACGYLTVGKTDSLQHVRSVILKGHKRVNVLKTLPRRKFLSDWHQTLYTWMSGKLKLQQFSAS